VYGFWEKNPETYPARIITSGSITGTLKQSRIVYNDNDSPTPEKFWTPPTYGKIMAVGFYYLKVI
jgi:hypothetical protein